jgi:hypothetical protein
MAACSGPVTLQSRSMSEAPSVDGRIDEWGGNLDYLDDEPVAMSASPTDSLLYVAIVIQDRALIRTVAANGLIVWVDPTGGQKRGYGIQYPVGLRAQRAGQRETSSEASGQPARGLDQINLSELNVVWHDSTRRRLPAHFSSGLRAKATLDPGSLIYELAIPVGEGAGGSARRKHGLPSSLRSAVGIGLQTPEPGDGDTDLSMPDRGIPSVTGRPGQGRTRRGRRGQRRQTPEKPDQDEQIPTLDLWTKVVTEAK